MPKRIRTKSQIVADAPDEQKLRRFIELLNTKEYWGASLISGKQKIGGDYRPIQAELRRLTEAWTRSKRNVCKLFDAQPELSLRAQSFRPDYIPTPTNTARLLYLAAVEYSETALPREIAIELFLRFLLNPLNTRLGGPCKNCCNYYFRETEHRSVYCKTKCGRDFTSRATQKKSREARTRWKIKKVSESISKWLRNRSSIDWRDFVSVDTPISKNWLTRALKDKLIKEPVKSLRKLGSTHTGKLSRTRL